MEPKLSSYLSRKKHACHSAQELDFLAIVMVTMRSHTSTQPRLNEQICSLYNSMIPMYTLASTPTKNVCPLSSKITTNFIQSRPQSLQLMICGQLDAMLENYSVKLPLISLHLFFYQSYSDFQGYSSSGF